jgi:hypothetical protein
MRKTVFIISGIVLLIVLIILIARSSLNSTMAVLSGVMEDKRLDSSTYVKTASKEYWDLFKSPGNMIWDLTDKSKRRNDISQCYYEKQFYILVYKIDTIGSLSLNKFIATTFTGSSLALNVEYKNDDNNYHFRISFKEGPKEKISHVTFKLSGDQTKILQKNDSIAYYYSNFSNLSITTNNNSVADIYGTVKKEFEGEQIPIEVLFLKRKSNLYFILLGAKDKHQKLGNSLLYGLLKW